MGTTTHIMDFGIRYLFDVVYIYKGTVTRYLLQVIAHDARNAIQVFDSISEARGGSVTQIETVTRGKKIDDHSVIVIAEPSWKRV